MLTYIPKQKHYAGLVLTSSFALASMYLADLAVFKKFSISSLIIAIILGAIYGNLIHHKMPKYLHDGIVFSLKKVLRVAIVLLGFRITFHEIFDVGITGFVMDLIMLSSTFLLSVYLGVRFFKLDKDTAMLVGAGSSVCGASAVLAAEVVLDSQGYKAALAVATVTIFGTISMFVYPALYKAGIFSGLDDNFFGIFVGSTVHEVAQVVAAGFSISEHAGETATIVKLTRVMMLAPLLIILSFFLVKKKEGGKIDLKLVPIPWFVIVFIAVSGFNSLGLTGADTLSNINEFDVFLLTLSMAALGIETNVNKIKNAGLKPIYLGFFLFLWLIIGGYFVSLGVKTLF